VASQAKLYQRPLQREVIVAALDGDDVFLQAATSFGKSLCFQLPAVIDHGSKYSCVILFSLCLTISSHHCDLASLIVDGE
jgi:superfamily II DNA/RNA helicase